MNLNECGALKKVRFIDSTGQNSNIYRSVSVPEQADVEGTQNVRGILKNKNNRQNLQKFLCSSLQKNYFVATKSLFHRDKNCCDQSNVAKESFRIPDWTTIDKKKRDGTARRCGKMILNETIDSAHGFVHDKIIVDSEICEPSISMEVRLAPSLVTHQKHRRAPMRSENPGPKPRTASPLFIDKLKSEFKCVDHLSSQIRIQRNWCPRFVTKYFRGGGQREENTPAPTKRNLSNYVPHKPNVYSIGLRTGVIRRPVDDHEETISRQDGPILNLKGRLDVSEKNLKSRHHTNGSNDKNDYDNKPEEFASDDWPSLTSICARVSRKPLLPFYLESLLQTDDSKSKRILSLSRRACEKETLMGYSQNRGKYELSKCSEKTKHKIPSRLSRPVWSSPRKNYCRGKDPTRSKISPQCEVAPSHRSGQRRETGRPVSILPNHVINKGNLLLSKTPHSVYPGASEVTKKQNTIKSMSQKLDKLRKPHAEEVDLRKKAGDFICTDKRIYDKIKSLFVGRCSSTKDTNVRNKSASTQRKSTAQQWEITSEHPWKCSKESHPPNFGDNAGGCKTRIPLRTQTKKSTSWNRKRINNSDDHSRISRPKTVSGAKNTQSHYLLPERNKNASYRYESRPSKMEKLHSYGEDMTSSDDGCVIDVEKILQEDSFSKTNDLTVESILLEDNKKTAARRKELNEDILFPKASRFPKPILEGKITETTILGDIKRRIHDDFEYPVLSSKTVADYTGMSLTCEQSSRNQTDCEKALNLRSKFCTSMNSSSKSGSPLNSEESFSLEEIKLENTQSGSIITQYLRKIHPIEGDSMSLRQLAGSDSISLQCESSFESLQHNNRVRNTRPRKLIEDNERELNKIPKITLEIGGEERLPENDDDVRPIRLCPRKYFSKEPMDHFYDASPIISLRDIPGSEVAYIHERSTIHKRCLKNLSLQVCRRHEDDPNVDLKTLITNKKSINLFDASSRSSKQNFVESIDSGVLTDFSRNDSDQCKNGMKRERSPLGIEDRNVLRKENCLTSPENDIDSNLGSDASYSDFLLTDQVEIAVKKFTEELILCERRATARVKARNAAERRATDLPERRKYFQQTQYCPSPRSTKTGKSCCTLYGSHEFSKMSQWSSEEDHLANISSPSLTSLSDSEINVFLKTCN